MHKPNFLHRHKLLSLLLIIFLLSIIAMIIGGLMGGDLLDGFAGGPTTNTPLESFLMASGFFVTLPTLALIIVVSFYLFVRNLLFKHR